MWRWICLGVDVGTTNPFAGLLLGTSGSDMYLAAEWRYDSSKERRSLTDAEYSARLRRWLAEYRPAGADRPGVTPEMVAVDPSAASFVQQLYRDGFSPTPAANAVISGIRLFSSLLVSGRLKIHSSCRGLIDEMPSYSWDPKQAKRGIDAPLKVADHSIDAARYAIATSEASWRNPGLPVDPAMYERADTTQFDFTRAAV